ncbi:AGE family epimerase/isomerase [Demequina sp. TTPB684]|uniref:AGE family epimerase/isomerase n=1 Tax=unclassified Demequina TaxID=2620311 RepID=UPI001CF28A6A|nr:MULTISPECIES: AGE family epimerase/isomerase [unclassified Demequina]MCB2413101.1 AGE family epimerase/isomerase [Demequina sp. TTPB684]UPU89264.1 AGE family epimerase/isomerase [Demequina sp. TMPB413]
MTVARPGSAEFRVHQRADLLRFAAGSVVPDGFGWLDESGSVSPDHPTELWITCRMTHVAALGVLAHEEPAPGGPDVDALRAMAAHGVRALAAGALRDRVHGGWRASVRDGASVNGAKQAYGHAFVVLAASSAAAAGIDGAKQLLADALAVSEERFWDDEQGLSVDSWDEQWTSCDPYRGINANMHTVEAYLAAGDVTGESLWHVRAGRIAARVAEWASAHQWRIPEHFTPEWVPLLEHNIDQPADPFQPYGATVGHGLEWARLLLATEATLAEASPPALRSAAVALYDRAVADGWAADGADGFVYTTDWQGKPVVQERMHWVLAEAINTAVALAHATGEERYAADLERWWDYANDFLIDTDNGSWRHELDAMNRPSAKVWPGKPDVYHAYQAALMEDVPLTPSFARALSDLGGLG